MRCGGGARSSLGDLTEELRSLANSPGVVIMAAETWEDPERRDEKSRIRDSCHAEDLVAALRSCPKCRWHPDPSSRWSCTCYFVWNTFETRGQCPGCSRVWLHTECLSCSGWSPHEDGYHEPIEEVADNVHEDAVTERTASGTACRGLKSCLPRYRVRRLNRLRTRKGNTEAEVASTNPVLYGPDGR